MDTNDGRFVRDLIAWIMDRGREARARAEDDRRLSEPSAFEDGRSIAFREVLAEAITRSHEAGLVDLGATMDEVDALLARTDGHHVAIELQFASGSVYEAQSEVQGFLDEVPRVLGARFAGLWLDVRGRVVSVRVKDPTVEDVRVLDQGAGEAGWWVQVVGSRYGEAEVGVFKASVDEIARRERPHEGIGAFRSWGSDPKLGAVRVTIGSFDEHICRDVLAAVPPDALALTIRDERWTGYGTLAEGTAAEET